MVQLYHTRFTEIMKCITLNDPQNDVMGPEYGDKISNVAWMLFILLSETLLLTSGAKNKQHKNEIPFNAYMLQTSLEVLLTHSNHRYDVHFCQMKNGEAIELVIKGKQKKDMASDIQENISKVVGIELDTEVLQKIKELTDYIRKILSEVFKQPVESLTLEDKLVDLNKLTFLAKQLDDRYTSQCYEEEIDETMFIKSSNVPYFDPDSDPDQVHASNQTSNRKLQGEGRCRRRTSDKQAGGFRAQRADQAHHHQESA